LESVGKKKKSKIAYRVNVKRIEKKELPQDGGKKVGERKGSPIRKKARAHKTPQKGKGERDLIVATGRPPPVSL